MSVCLINWQTTIVTATAESCVVAVKFTYFTVWSSVTRMANTLIRLIAEASHWSCMEHSITSLIIRFIFPNEIVNLQHPIRGTHSSQFTPVD